MFILRILASATLFASCAALPSERGVAPTNRTSGVHDAIVQVAETLFAAMEARDTSTIRRIFVPEARLAIVRVEADSEPRVQFRGVSEFISSIARSPEPLRERMWSPRVEVNGDFASLWAPYDFHQGERFTHCGVDAFHLVRLADEWKIATLSYTVQAASCPPSPGEP